ncbi:MAG: response regulator [Chloroflexota bacterium]
MTDTTSILVIEDDHALSEVLREVIEVLGYEAHIIADGLEALTYLRGQVPDIIFLDMHLPNVPGMDILHFIKGNTGFDNTQVIVMTADSVLRQEAEIYTLALLKPFTIDDVQNALSKAVARMG